MLYHRNEKLVYYLHLNVMVLVLYSVKKISVLLLYMYTMLFTLLQL